MDATPPHRPRFRPGLGRVSDSLRRDARRLTDCVTLHALSTPRASHGDEQRGPRYAVIVQSDALPLSTLLVAPTSTSACAASFRPEIVVNGTTTRVLVEQASAVDPTRLGEQVGYLGFNELRQLDAALRIVLEL